MARAGNKDIKGRDSIGSARREDPEDVVDQRLTQAQALIACIGHASQTPHQLTDDAIFNATWGVRALLDQAEEALAEVHQNRREAPQ
jgi:hypothetical protein